MSGWRIYIQQNDLYFTAQQRTTERRIDAQIDSHTGHRADCTGVMQFQSRD